MRKNSGSVLLKPNNHFLPVSNTQSKGGSKPSKLKQLIVSTPRDISKNFSFNCLKSYHSKLQVLFTNKLNNKIPIQTDTQKQFFFISMTPSRTLPILVFGSEESQFCSTVVGQRYLLSLNMHFLPTLPSSTSSAL